MVIPSPIEGIVATHSTGDIGIKAEFGCVLIFYTKKSSKLFCFFSMISTRCRYFVPRDRGITVAISMNGNKNICKRKK